MVKARDGVIVRAGKSITKSDGRDHHLTIAPVSLRQGG
jgi:hypothetical protein